MHTNTEPLKQPYKDREGSWRIERGDHVAVEGRSSLRNKKENAPTKAHTNKHRCKTLVKEGWRRYVCVCVWSCGRQQRWRAASGCFLVRQPASARPLFSDCGNSLFLFPFRCLRASVRSTDVKAEERVIAISTKFLVNMCSLGFFLHPPLELPSQTSTRSVCRYECDCLLSTPPCVSVSLLRIASEGAQGRRSAERLQVKQCRLFFPRVFGLSSFSLSSVAVRWRLAQAQGSQGGTSDQKKRQQLNTKHREGKGRGGGAVASPPPKQTKKECVGTCRCHGSTFAPFTFCVIPPSVVREAAGKAGGATTTKRKNTIHKRIKECHRALTAW